MAEKYIAIHFKEETPQNTIDDILKRYQSEEVFPKGHDLFSGGVYVITLDANTAQKEYEKFTSQYDSFYQTAELHEPLKIVD